MSSKRSLKKSIRYTCGSIAGECILADLRFEDLDQDKVENIVCHLATLQELTVDKVTAHFDKKTADFADAKEYRKARTQYFKQYYNDLRKGLTENLTKVVDEMNAMLTPEQKEANKKEAAE